MKRIFSKGGMNLDASNELVAVSFDKGLPVCHLHGSPEECSLHNKTDPYANISALHFGVHGFVHVPNEVGDQLVALGVVDHREQIA